AYQGTYTVVPPPGNSGLTPVANTITAGTSATLTPAFANGSGLVTGTDGSSYAVAPGTGFSVAPSSTTTYTLAVTNPAGTTTSLGGAATVTVVAAPTIASFTGPA